MTLGAYRLYGKQSGLGGELCFVSFDPSEQKIKVRPDIEEESRLVTPSSDAGIEHYSFQNIAELEKFIDLARKESLSTLFQKVRKWVRLFYDTDTEEYINLIAADIVFTYFQDRIGKTHYMFVWGEPDTGKGAILETFNQLAYRGVSVTSQTAATIYRQLGSIEKGQVILIIDEANTLEEDNFLLNVLKVGYKGTTKVPRVMDAQSSQFSKVESFLAYCFKIIAAEKLPSQWKTGGFLSRCFQIKSAPGDPQIDIGDVVDNADDPKNAKLMAELSEDRKILFVYKLLHYSEPIPDVKIKGIVARDRELIKPLLRLFKVHGGNDDKTFETIKKTLHYFVKERNSDKTESFKATILKLTQQLLSQMITPILIRECSLTKKSGSTVKDQLNGEEVDDKPGTFKTELFGEISTKWLTGTLRAIGGKPSRNSAGDKRVWTFDDKTLRRFQRVYREIPASIELEEGEEDEEQKEGGEQEEHDEQ